MGMDHIDLDTSRIMPARRRNVLRWVIRGLFALCFVLILKVILSEPTVSARVQTAVDDVAERLDSQPDEPAGKPAARQMPTDRVPVRRSE